MPRLFRLAVVLVVAFLLTGLSMSVAVTKGGKDAPKLNWSGKEETEHPNLTTMKAVAPRPAEETGTIAALLSQPLLKESALTSFLKGESKKLSLALPQGERRARGLEDETGRRKERREEYLRKHTDSKGEVRPDLWKKGVEDTKKMKIAAGITINRASGGSPSATGKSSPLATEKAAPVVMASGGVVGVQWTQIGPAPLFIDAEANFQGAGPDSGEVTDIAIDPRNTTDRTIYISSNDGGIWKSTDGGSNWLPKTDFMISLSMGAVALDPGNPSIVYAGTGNLFNNGFFKGVGIYKSIDGGDTWSVVGASVLTNRGINRIVVPAANTLLVATNVGLFLSIDGGNNFGNNSPLFNNGSAVLGGFITDIHLDTASPSTTILAAVNGTGIFRSTDGGKTFPTNLWTAVNGAPTANVGYIGFAQSTQPNNQTIYATVKDTRAQTVPPQPAPFPFLGLYESTDGGANWTRMAAADSAGNGCQCGYDQTVGVDPQDANRVYIGFQEMYLSTNGGVGPFSNVSANQVHFDHHALVFSPATHVTAGPPTRLYVGEDGGIARTDNGGGNWTNINGAIATNLFREIDIGRGNNINNGYTYGGTQDTGTIEHRPNDNVNFPGTVWRLGIDGDGGPTAVDPCNPLHAIGDDDGGFSQTTNGGATWAGAAGFPANTSIGRVAFDPNCGTAYAAVSISNAGPPPTTSFQLFQSTDNGANFATIHTFTQPITAIAQTNIDSSTMWVGLADGTVQRSSNVLAGAASTWSPLTVTGSPGQGVSALAIDPSNTSQVVVVYPGFCGGGCAPGNRTRHVFRTIDNGGSWADISGTNGGGQNLPDIPLNSIVIDPGTAPHTIIVASDAAVMRSPDLGATWQVLGVGLPTVDGTSLQIDPSATPSLLRIGTYGRSVFELTAASGPLLAVNANLAFGSVCVGANATSVIQLFNVGSADLHISSIFRSSGSADFQIISGPATPVTIMPGEEIDYTVRFQPTSAGNETATFQINSDDPTQPARQLSASGTGITQLIATFIADTGDFGGVCVGSFKDLDLTISNPGGCDLSISNITSSSAEFKTAQTLSFPLVVQGGTSIEVPIRFQPTSIGGPKNANITISSNAPAPNNIKVVAVTGHSDPGDIRVTGSTDFGDVCAGTLAEKTVSICNVGNCNLNVTSVSLGSCTDFHIINNPFPAPVSPDSCLGVVIRFTPTSAGPKSCTLTINSDDPDTPVITQTVTANTPEPSIDVSPDQNFAPEVIQSIGACTTLQPFPISNKGTCNLTITNITIGGTNATDFGLSALPSFPIILQPGHTVGDGALMTVFAPTQIDRDRLGTLTVTYVSDPITGATTSVKRDLCGEGVRTGARVLVTNAGVPVPVVAKMQIQRITGNRNKPIVDTVDTAMNLSLQTVTPTGPCASFQYHREYGTVSNPIQLLPGSYVVTATAVINGRRKNLTVAFDVTTCDFNPNVLINFP